MPSCASFAGAAALGSITRSIAAVGLESGNAVSRVRRRTGCQDVWISWRQPLRRGRHDDREAQDPVRPVLRARDADENGAGDSTMTTPHQPTLEQELYGAHDEV